MTLDSVRVDWRFGNVCDWDCSYCPSIFKNGSSQFFDTEQVKDACDRLIEHYEKLNCRVEFSFIGGEPTIHPGFISIVRGLHNRGAGAIIHTNGGSKDLNWWKEARQYVHAINLSIHLERVDMEAMESHYIPLLNLFESSLETTVQIPYLPEYETQADKISTLIKEKTGRDAPKRVLYQDSPQNTKLYDYGNLENASDKNIINSKRFNYKDWNCYAGVDQLVIDPAGNIWRAWCRIGGKLGNVTDIDLQLPTTPIICSRTICRNNFDLVSKKVKLTDGISKTSDI